MQIVGKENRRWNRKEAGTHIHQIGLTTDKLVLFLACVINCSEQVKSKNERTKIIVKAAAKFLNMKDLLWEKHMLTLVKERGHQTTVSNLFSNVHTPMEC